MWRWALMLAFIVGAHVVAVHAVQYWVAGYTWTMSSRPPLVPTWRVVSIDELHKFCGGRPHGFFGCAKYELGKGECVVYASQAEFDIPEWQRWHELLHCAGWDHL